MLQEKEFGRNEFGDNTDKNEKRKMRENLSENPLKIALEWMQQVILWRTFYTIFLRCLRAIKLSIV